MIRPGDLWVCDIDDRYSCVYSHWDIDDVRKTVNSFEGPIRRGTVFMMVACIQKARKKTQVLSHREIWSIIINNTYRFVEVHSGKGAWIEWAAPCNLSEDE